MCKNKNMLVYILVFLSYCNGQYFIGDNKFKYMENVFKWKQIGYKIGKVLYTKDTPHEKVPGGFLFEEDLSDEEMFFKQSNNVPIGFEVYKDRAFVTVPRRRYGIPSTLNYVDLETANASALLRPYPDYRYDFHSTSELVSVYRPRVDNCDRLWMVDTGLLEVPKNFVQKKPPRIIVFDLKTDEVVLNYEIPSDVLINGTTSGLTSITVDVTSTTCDDAYAYINDLAQNGLIVFSMKEMASWRFSHSSFIYDEGAKGFEVAEATINWQDGLFSIALSDPNENGVRTAYYHPFISTLEFSITTDILKNKSANFEKHYKREGVRGAFSQSGSHGYHSGSGVLFYASAAKDGIMCWNTNRPLVSNISVLIAQDHDQLSYISDLKVRGDDVWVLSNKIPTFIYFGLDPLSSNFYVFRGKAQDLIKDTECDVSNIKE
ncbi:unnamed protein product [Chrysodeixis includens]|uniref:Uncharacterized protein n=1 Tax=Chrysodeixis includens TaxID=689277 RepID=A0A9P0FXV3_CHRIL|nr:unnamed protein product [Chrysodeixis includens]